MRWREQDVFWLEQVDDASVVVASRMARSSVDCIDGIQFLNIPAVFPILLATRLSRQDHLPSQYFRWVQEHGESSSKIKACNLSQWYQCMTDDWKMVVDVLSSNLVMDTLQEMLGVRDELTFSTCEFVREQSGYERELKHDFDICKARLEIFLPPIDKIRDKGDIQLSTTVSQKTLEGRVTIAPQDYVSNRGWACLCNQDTKLARGHSDKARNLIVVRYK